MTRAFFCLLLFCLGARAQTKEKPKPPNKLEFRCQMPIVAAAMTTCDSVKKAVEEVWPKIQANAGGSWQVSISLKGNIFNLKVECPTLKAQAQKDVFVEGYESIPTPNGYRRVNHAEFILEMIMGAGNQAVARIKQELAKKASANKGEELMVVEVISKK